MTLPTGLILGPYENSGEALNPAWWIRLENPQELSREHNALTPALFMYREALNC